MAYVPGCSRMTAPIEHASRLAQYKSLNEYMHNYICVCIHPTTHPHMYIYI